MKAIYYTKYGTPDEVLKLKDVEKPAPGNGEVLVKIYAASVNFIDSHLVTGEPFIARLLAGGILEPKYKIPGADISGRVEAVGRNITQFHCGDEVFGDLSGYGWGGFAEYVCVPENALARKPAGLTFDEAAAVPQTAVSALQCLRDSGGIQSGQKVLINGASGGVGTFAIQIAKSFGTEVTGVCSSKNLELVRSIGADQVIDYTREDFTRNGKRYDLIVATAGYHSIFDYRRALSPRGVYVMIGGTMNQKFQAVFLGPWLSMSGGKKMVALNGKPNQKDLSFVKELIEDGKVKPVVDRSYLLTDVSKAFQYVEEGHARGKVVITVTE